MNQDVQNDQINNILAKCWADASFKQQLLADPTAVLKAEGVEIPAGYTIRVLENTDKVVNYVLPPNPNAELSDSELESVAGGKGGGFNPGQFFTGVGELARGTGLAATGVGGITGGKIGVAGIKNNQLFIDEGFTACDNDNLGNVPDVLNELLNTYSAIVLVSHLDDLKHGIKSFINIDRDMLKGLSKINFGVVSKELRTVKQVGRPKKIVF